MAEIGPDGKDFEHGPQHLRHLAEQHQAEIGPNNHDLQHGLRLQEGERDREEKKHPAEVMQLAGQVRQFTEGRLSPQQSVEVAKKALKDAAGNQELLQMTTLAAIEDLIQAIQAQQQKAARMMGMGRQLQERARFVRHRN